MFSLLPSICRSEAYSVVVLPLPVGPVTSRMPCGWSIWFFQIVISFSAKPRSSNATQIERLSRIRSTHFSPVAVGSVLMRKSILRLCTMARIRPSCGRRRSAISRLAMIFRREMMAACIVCGGFIDSNSTPSIR